MRLGRTGNVEFDFPQELVIVIDEGEIDFNGLPYAGIRKVLFHSLAIRLVRQLFPNLGEVVLTIGIVNVGQEFGAFAYELTPPPE